MPGGVDLTGMLMSLAVANETPPAGKAQAEQSLYTYVGVSREKHSVVLKQSRENDPGVAVSMKRLTPVSWVGKRLVALSGRGSILVRTFHSGNNLWYGVLRAF